MAKTEAEIPYKPQEAPPFDDLMHLIKEARDVFSAEPTLLELNKPVLIVGDIHGQHDDLMRILALPSDESSAAYNIRRFLFLGDYVDRGLLSVPIMVRLMQLKIKHPKTYNLLRGNHETGSINLNYGFMDELKSIYPTNQAQTLWAAFNEMFAYLPLAALVHKRILCMHGGISQHLNSLQDIRNIRRPIEDVNTVPLACDLLWADPMTGVHGYQHNEIRGVSVVFGEEMVLATCKRLNIDMIVRAHQVMYNGYSMFCNRRVVTIFSASRYCPDKNNKGTVLVVSKDMKISFILLAPVTPGTAGHQNYLKTFRELEMEQTLVNMDQSAAAPQHSHSEVTRGSTSSNNNSKNH